MRWLMPMSNCGVSEFPQRVGHARMGGRLGFRVAMLNS